MPIEDPNKPPSHLPALGAAVEVMMLGGKPAPKERYARGHVRSYRYDAVFGCWRVDVELSEPAGAFYGHKVLATSTFAWMIHVIGATDPAFSEMYPEEIEALYHNRLAHYLTS